MKPLIILIATLTSALGVQIRSFDYTSKQIEDMEEGLNEWRAVVAAAPSMPPEKAIPELGLGLKKTSMESIYVVGDRVGVRKQLQEALLAIPGHAEYFGNQIEEIEQKFKEKAESEKRAGTFVGEDQSQPLEEMLAFQILRELPSPETLRVLGEIILKEQRVLKTYKEDRSDMSAFIEQVPPARLAIEALISMIEDPPTLDRPMFPFNLQTWQHWYQQVKEGRRTVRFKGDPKDYSLEGPVAEARNPDVPRTAKRPEATTTPKASTHAAYKPDSSWVGWLVGILGVIASAFYFHQRSKRAT